MTGWGSVAKHVVPDLPEAQRRALDEYRYSSALYINVLLKHWRPIADIGAFEMYWPSGYCTWMHVSDPLSVGDYRPEYRPDKPTILSMYKYVHQRGLEPREQMELGRYEMERKTFEDYEREIRTELNHVLGANGFDAARDIAGITVNRWGHGYNYFKEPGPRENARESALPRGKAEARAASRSPEPTPAEPPGPRPRSPRHGGPSRSSSEAGLAPAPRDCLT